MLFRSPWPPRTVAALAPPLRRARVAAGPPLHPVHDTPELGYKSRPPRAQILPHHATPVATALPTTPHPSEHHQEGGIAAAGLLLPCNFPPEPRLRSSTIPSCHRSPLPLCPPLTPTWTPHSHAPLPSLSCAQDRRQDLAVDLRCPRRRSCSPPTDPTTPAPAAHPIVFPSPPPSICTLAAVTRAP